jgi:hypothetical protein
MELIEVLMQSPIWKEIKPEYMYFIKDRGFYENFVRY